MSIEKGTYVLVDGKVATVVNITGRRWHRFYELSDGRVIGGLDKLVAAGEAEVDDSPRNSLVPEETRSSEKEWAEELIEETLPVEEPEEDPEEDTFSSEVLLDEDPE